MLVVFDLTLGLCVKDFLYNASNLWKKIRMIDYDACHQLFHRHKVDPPRIYNATYCLRTSDVYMELSPFGLAVLLTT